PTTAGAQQADVIRGRITGPDSAAVEGATITATSIGGNVSRSARTDKNGRFTITFPGGDGDYMVSVTLLGYAPRRFEVKRVADEEILLADARLTRMGALLEDVTVTAARPRMARTDTPPEVSGTEQAISNAAVPADLLGDLAAMAATLPGVTGVPGVDGAADGYSVLGLGADQNNAVLNGMSFGGSSLPRDAAVSSSVITSPYDVSRGGFSGAQMNLRTRSGSNFITRGMSLNVDAPQMQWTDRAARSLGQEYSNFSLGGAMSGPIKFDRSFYNMSYQLGRRSSDLYSLLSTGPDGFQAAGVSPDSVARALALMQARGIPLDAGAPGDRVGDQGSVFGSIDVAPPSSSSGQALNFSFNGNWNRQRPIGGQATELPSYSGERTNWRGGVQGRHSGYFRNSILSETSLGFALSRNHSTPFLDMPAGIVRVNSDLDDGTRSLQSLSFGGNQRLNSTQRTATSNFLNQLSWFSVNNKHRVKLTSELRFDTNEQESANNTLGTFTFNSLADYGADRPATFSRELRSRDRSVGQLTAGFSLGDAYRRTNRLQIQYGVRVDANRFTSRPELNPEVESLFGARNDFVPNRIYLSPRVGFSWSYGSAAQVAGFEGAARGPRAVVRGGIGVFQNTPNTNLIASAIDNTGLPGATQQVMCVGGAAPTPDWDAYASDPASIPTQCADGTSGTGFANAAPNVSLFSSDYSSPSSIRSNLQWNSPVLSNRFNFQIEGTYSLNLDQQGTTDLNFGGVQRFALANEAGRPVFVPTTSIVPTTGAVAPQQSRKTTEFSRVTEIGSDLRSESRQLSMRISPVRFSPNFNWSLAYVLSDVREQVRGFSNTAGNPLETEWTRSGFNSRHQFVYNVGYNLFDFVRVNWFGQLRSGTPFTPMVAGDVNGDGYSNDRAFIFDPATADAELSTAMRNLLDNGSPEARSCLASQLGELAGRNSCRGPWYSTASMSITFNPLKVRMPHRSSLSFSLSNPLGAADMLFNGDELRGWGQPAPVDQALLYVRGFDPASQRFRYEVNERFGGTNRALTGMRAPVTLTAMLRFDLGPMRERQMLTQQLDRGRRTQGTRIPEGMFRGMYNGGGLLNPMATILRQQDSLRLTGPQADSIAVLNRAYTIRTDAIWAPLAKEFAELPDNYDRDAVYARYMRARKETVDLLMRHGPTIKRLLTAEQIRKLPAFVAGYLEPRYLASIRNGTATFTGGGMPGGAVFTGGGGMMSAGGGGQRIEIIRQ
ncbi:MAG TPA: TonB-dependent receptor, partial [Gemmatimonadaceae bacterium]|nr:TonB-dependent receptor [Gemmatimonadaceae bacterium]